MGNAWPIGGTRPAKPGQVVPMPRNTYLHPHTRAGIGGANVGVDPFRSSGQAVGGAKSPTYDPFDRPVQRSLPSTAQTVRYGRWLRPGLFALPGLLAGAILRKYYDEFLEPATRFIVPSGWETICQTTEPNLQGNPLWQVWPGANACGFGGGVVSPANWHDPPPAGYEGYLATPVWNPTDGHRCGFITPTKVLQGINDQIWFHYWYGRNPAPELEPPTEFPGYRPTVSPIEQPGPQPLPELNPVERGPQFRPYPLTHPMFPMRPHPVVLPAPFSRVRPRRPRDTPDPEPTNPGPGVGTRPQPRPNPRRRGGSEVEVKFRRATKRDRGKPRSQPRPRERKYYATGGVATVLTGIGFITETMDFFEAVWFSLSKRSRSLAYKTYGRQPSFLERAAWSLSHSSDISWEAFVKNFTSMQAGDRSAAHSARGLREFNQRVFERTGIDMRGRDPQTMFRRMQDELGMEWPDLVDSARQFFGQ